MTRRDQRSRPLAKRDAGQTLQELEGSDWGEPPYDSRVVTECHRPRRVPLEAFTIEELRLMIGQNISTEYLVSLALDLLEFNPLAEGDFYPGDLLVSVATIPPAFWREHDDLHARATELARRTLEHIRLRGAMVKLHRDRRMIDDLEHFLRETAPVGRLGSPRS